MERYITKKLIEWKQTSPRKPLLLEGARQVGKTYILKHFGENNFASYHHFDFEEQTSLKSVFNQDLNSEQLIETLSIRIGKKINPEQELIIFDEVQHVPSALTSLKYFAERHPDWFIAASGSLLGIGLNDVSFPVGKVHRLRMYPMTFYEFLGGTNNGMLLKAIENFNLQQVQSEVVHQEIWMRLKYYFITGGLPEVVKTFHDTTNDLPKALRKVRELQRTILADYKDDIAKHSGKLAAVKIDAVFDSVPLQLARETTGVKKFVFKNVLDRDSKYAELEAPIQWLLRAGLFTKCLFAKKRSFPLRHILMRIVLCFIFLMLVFLGR